MSGRMQVNNVISNSSDIFLTVTASSSFPVINKCFWFDLEPGNVFWALFLNYAGTVSAEDVLGFLQVSYHKKFILIFACYYT